MEELQVMFVKEPAKELAVQSRFFLWKWENWPTLVAKFQGFFSHFCWIGNHLRDSLAKFGYK
jgi:hypothetical protein